MSQHEDIAGLEDKARLAERGQDQRRKVVAGFDQWNAGERSQHKFTQMPVTFTCSTAIGATTR